MPSHFRKLHVYRLAEDLANDVHRVVLAWPGAERDLAKQLRRAADSVPANIAEACGKPTKADRRRILSIAKGSLYEAEHFLATAEKRGLVPDGMSERAVHAARVLNRFIERPGGR